MALARSPTLAHTCGLDLKDRAAWMNRWSNQLFGMFRHHLVHNCPIPANPIVMTSFVLFTKISLWAHLMIMPQVHPILRYSWCNWYSWRGTSFKSSSSKNRSCSFDFVWLWNANTGQTGKQSSTLGDDTSNKWFRPVFCFNFRDSIRLLFK